MSNAVSYRGYTGEVLVDIEKDGLYAKLINAPGVYFICEDKNS